MGNNHSKPCSGVPERENRRAEQERIQRMPMTQQARLTYFDSEEATVHIFCGEDEVDRYLEETNAPCVMFHFKVVESPEMKPENPLEAGETQSFVEKPRAAEIASAVLVEAKVAKSGGDAMVKSEPKGEVLVRSEPSGDIMVVTDSQPTELDLPLACVCNKVVRALHIVEGSFRDPSERTKGLSAGEGLSPFPTESQLSILSSGSKTVSPPTGATESLNAEDVHHPNEEALLANDQKAPSATDLDLAMENALDAAKEPTTGQMQLDEASSEETLGAVSEASSDLDSEETLDECSGVKTNLGTPELAQILLSLRNDLPRAVSESHLILDEMEEKMPRDYCDEENMRTRLEVVQKRAQREMLDVVDSEDEIERPIASKIFPTSESTCRAHRRSICKKTHADDILLESDAVDLNYLQKDGAIFTPEAMKVLRNVEALPPADAAEMTTEVSSPKALLETAQTGQDGPQEGSSAYPAEPVVPVSRTEENLIGARLPPLQDGASV